MIPLIKAIQARTATVAISPSTVRGQGEGGVVDAARDFLTGLNLHRFGVGDAEMFRASLREATKELKAAFPAKARSWGRLGRSPLQSAMYQRDLSDREWAILAPFFPATPPRRGGQWRDHRVLLSGVFHRLRTGCPWRDLPGRYGPWQTAYDRFRNLRRTGTLDRILSALQLRLNDAGRIDHSLNCVDGTNVRASRAAAGAAKKNPSAGEPADHALGRSRGGFGTKVHLVTDANRLPLAVVLTPGPRQECTQFEWLMDAVRVPARRGRPRRRPTAVAGDKGCSHRGIRGWLRRRKVKAVIPYRADQRPDDGRHRFDAAAHKRRAGVEQCIGWLKENRAVGTRFDKLAVPSAPPSNWPSSDATSACSPNNPIHQTEPNRNVNSVGWRVDGGFYSIPLGPPRWPLG